MNVINLCKDIINFESSIGSNNLLICKEINLSNYSNVKKICLISKLDTVDLDASLGFIITNIEKLYDTEYNIIFLTHKDHIDDITFIIAGYTTKICNINRINCYMYGKFIQSTLDKHTKIDEDFLGLANKNKYILERNMYNQMHNIYRVLDQVNTKYCIKHRSDEYYINMNEFINLMKTNDKLIINNLFFSGIEYYISDHIFGSTTISIKKMINNLKDILERKKIINKMYLSHTEKVFGVAYLYDKYSMVELAKNEKQILLDNFYVYDCEKFDDYLFSTMNSGSNITFIHNKYSKSMIQKKFRLWIKKNVGYKDENLSISISEDELLAIKKSLMSVKSLII